MTYDECFGLVEKECGGCAIIEKLPGPENQERYIREGEIIVKYHFRALWLEDGVIGLLTYGPNKELGGYRCYAC